MLRKIEKSAKSKEEALKLAAEDLGVSVDELSYEIEREVGKGLMGLLLGKEVILTAWITKEEEQERKIAEEVKKRAQTEKVEAGENPYAPKTTPHAQDHTPGGRKKKAKSADAPQKPEKVESADKVPAAPEKEAAPKADKKNHEVTEKSIEDAKFFATELIHRIGLADAEVDVQNGGDCVRVTVSGEKMGLLIGKRGDTLDAVQYLTSLYVNKAKNSYIKVNIDTENYRAKREETLVKLAKSLERRVAREKNAITLEPMSPNERRIIHAALQNSNVVNTYSIDEEPRRKIVVAPK